MQCKLRHLEYVVGSLKRPQVAIFQVEVGEMPLTVRRQQLFMVY